ncbi:MAG: hypothetical protein KGZ88_08495 [Methylomicrobium sp.]|nr:hypothetical protein [Methylomicrobium sp.]
MSTSDVLKARHSGMDRRKPEAMEGIGANFDNRETLLHSGLNHGYKPTSL